MTTMKKVGDEGWMKVKMRPLDEDLSDGDSVETLSEDSDRDTSTEDGKNPRDDVLPKPAMPDTTSSVDVNSGQEKVVDSNLVELDTPGNLADRLSKKLQDVVLVPARNSSHLSDAEMKFRYVVAASALLALICSLLVSSYLLFFKIQAISEESQDYSSVHVLQELDQVISKLQTVLRSENEQRLRDILSNMPPNFMNLNKMTVSEEALQNRKVPIESKDVSVEPVDGTEVKSGAEERGFIEEIHLQSSQESNESDVLTQTLPQSTPIHNLSQTVSPQTVPPSVDEVTRAENVSDMVEENPHPNQGESKYISVESVDGTEVKSGAEERGFIEEIHLQSSQESNESDVLTQTLPQSTPIHNLSQTVSPQTVPPSVDKVTRAENVSDMVEENPHPNQGEPKIPIVPPPPPVDAPKNENSHEEKQCSNYQNILLSVRRDILSVQQQIYSQIMNNLFDYKIDLYKNLLRLDIDMSCADGTLKRANHKNFMFIRNLQKIISKSSEANFESWYKFYSFSVLPKVRDIVGMLDSVTQGVERELEPGEEDQVGSKADMKSDDFFVRASLPNSDIDSEALKVHQNGFDWRNLNEKIRHLNLKRHKNRGDWLKESTNIKKDSRKNYVELEKGAETGDFSRGGDLDEVGEYHQINERLDREWHYEEMREENEGETEREIEERNERERGNGNNDEYKFDKRRNVKHGKISYERGCNEEKKESKNRGNERLGNEKKYKVKEEEKVDKRQLEKNKKQEKRRERKDEGRNRREELRFEQSHKGKRGFQEKEKFKDGEITDKRKLDGDMKYDRSHGNYEKYESARQQQNKYSNERCRARGRRDSYDRRGRKKSLLNDVTKYMKTAVSGLWDSVEKGIKQVKHYGEAVRSTMKNERSAKRENEAKSSEYEEWRNEFVKELKDLIRVVKGNPTINSLSEVAKSVKQFFGEGLSKVQTPVDNSRETEEMKGPEGIHEDENKEESHIPGTWYVEASKHRAESRGRYPRTGDSSWFLGLGRHRSYLRRRGIHLDDSGSWFMSSAKHRAEMRRSQTEPQAFLPA